ncbi:MAG TPA: aspartate ammonia-lyase [Gammaproteobacteria bacterium]|nr:aspartate ammonia-lyase [Gammaproteobacteria bacterium]|tara:strand:+ start:3215 stop:4594 length:1380 start_codon:yes stop_codon:yes gene_type:complete
MGKKRIVKDSMGTMEVDESALYGAQTQRAIDNFPVSGRKMPEEFIRALLLIKKNAASANEKLGCLDASVTNAIRQACDELLSDTALMVNFPIDVFQTGSGTSSNMNANEVIANIATRIDGNAIDANDQVNFGQSSNDVIPTAIHVSARLAIEQSLKPGLLHLIDTIEEKATSVAGFCKTGRTHLMDAMPVRMDQTLLGWASQLRQGVSLLNTGSESLQGLALGGTAVGTGINTHVDFAATFAELLSAELEVEFKRGDNFFALMGSQDPAVAVSGQLKSIAVTLLKIANDLRWMNSGPLAGLGEISLEALQPGSSIMPGKVNPVIPESVAMVAAEVIGNDATVTIAGQSGNFELNVMLPVIADNLLSSISLLGNSAVLLADKAIRTFQVNEAQLNNALHKNPILVTALNPVIGYLKAAEIAKIAYRENRPIIDVAAENTDIDYAELQSLLDPHKLTEGGL